MPTLGQMLREAREAKELSIAELSKKTHIMSKQLEGLEEDDFSRIPAPIYVKSFIKKFAMEVGLDPEEMVNHYLEVQKAGLTPPAPKAERSKKSKRGRKAKPKKSNPEEGLMPIGGDPEPAAPPVEHVQAVEAQSAAFEATTDQDLPGQTELEFENSAEPEAEHLSVVRPQREVPELQVRSANQAPSQPAHLQKPVSRVQDVQERPPREPRPSIAAVLAAKFKAIRWPKLSVPKFLKQKPSLPSVPDVNVPGREKPIAASSVKRFIGMAGAILALCLVILGVVYFVDQLEPSSGFGSELGDLRTNPVIMDPPPPYFAPE